MPDETNSAWRGGGRFRPAGTEDASEHSRHPIRRMRLETRRRTLTVESLERITPRMLRVRLVSPDLADFDSRSPDDHIKLFLTDPTTGEQLMRDYTPRAFDPATCRLTIDFALHEAGPATAWATGAKPGDTLQIGGPRGTMIVPDDFDWYLLVADETALPALGRRLEELRPGVAAITVAVVADAGEIQHIATAASWQAHWVRREDDPGANDPARLQKVVESLDLPAGDGYIWIAGEAKIAKSIRTYMIEERRHPPEWMRASGYWASGEPGAHESFG